jgi:hypothetical protein
MDYKIRGMYHLTSGRAGSTAIHLLRIVFIFLIPCCTGADDEHEYALDLSGHWAFRLDPDDKGMAESWWEAEFTDHIRLPGSLQEHGFGFDLEADLPYTARSPAIPIWRNSPIFSPYRDSGKVKLSWALTPPRYYVGAAWYRKVLTIPENWKGQNLQLFLERLHWVSDLWVDGQHIGQENSLCVPHTYLMDSLSPGRHQLVLRIDNRMSEEVGPNAHSLTDQTQTNWNGIIGRIELKAMAPVAISRLEIYPHIRDREVSLKVILHGHGQPAGEGVLRVRAVGQGRNKHKPPSRDYPVSWANGKGLAEISYPLGDQVALWDEFDPDLYQLETSLLVHQRLADHAAETFGMRQVMVRDTQIMINGNPVFIRGTLENAQYPDTGYPPMDVESWKSEIEAAQSYGLNHFRFHSWCPPEAAFIAADELGFYLQVEGPAWPEQVDPGSPIADFLVLETGRILETFGNHPSFIMMACGNEFGGSNGGRSYFPDSLLWYQLPPPAQVKQCLGAAFLASWLDHIKEKAGGRQIFSSSAGWPYIAENDYHIMHEPCRMRYVFDQLAPNTRIDYANLVRTHDVPIISHEAGQWCVYPDLAEDRTYQGYLRAANLEIWRDFASRNDVYRYAEAFHRSSGQFQVRLYKQEIEALLRTPGAGGFQLLGLNDYHGHGFAPVGVLDAHWQPKSYVSGTAFRRFCGPVVPLARMDKRVWRNNETFSADIEIAQYQSKDLSNIPVQWEIRDASGVLMDRGRFNSRAWPHGGLAMVGTIQSDLQQVKRAGRFILTVSLRATSWQNDWEFWVYPATPEMPDVPEIFISHELDSLTIQAIDSGRMILFLPDAGKVRAVNPGNFEPIFWSTWSGTGTLGIHCRNKHRALRDFPTQNHNNWQWWELLRTSLPLDLTATEQLDEPIVQVIDNWIRARELGLLFEFTIGQSRIMVCAMDIENDLDKRFVARQLRLSVLKYMGSTAFAPASSLALEEFKTILGQKMRGLAASGAIVYGSQDFPPHRAAQVIDGDPETYWEAGAVSDTAFELVVELPGYTDATGLRMIPFRRGPDQPVVDYRIFLSHDGTDWGDPVGRGLYPPVAENTQTIKFPWKGNVRFIKVQFIENEEFPVPYVSLAELELISNENN